MLTNKNPFYSLGELCAFALESQRKEAKQPANMPADTNFYFA
jgi:hypothetical protein